MYERQVELTVGESVRIDGVLVTIVDIDGDQIHVRIDDEQSQSYDREHREVVLALPR